MSNEKENGKSPVDENQKYKLIVEKLLSTCNDIQRCNERNAFR